MPNQEPKPVADSFCGAAAYRSRRERLLFICVIPALLTAVFLTWLISVDFFAPAKPALERALLEWRMKTPVPVNANVDVAEGNRTFSRTVRVEPDEDGNALVRMSIPREGRYHTFSLHILDQKSPIFVLPPRVSTPDGKWSRAASVTQFESDAPARVGLKGEVIAVDVADGKPFALLVNFRPPLEVPSTTERDYVSIASLGVFLWAVLTALFAWLCESRKIREAMQLLVAACVRNPQRALFAVAVLGVSLSTYPILLFGKSWVSPSCGQPLIYKTVPTTPFENLEAPENPVGSDSGATMTYHYPFSFHAHRAIFDDGEMPLWNRYSWCGISQAGQVIHMWGNPLYWLVICSGGASWAWDTMGILTRVIYAFGVALLVYRTTGSLKVAAVLTVSACFHGFFVFRTAHPAALAFAYMPWILLAWVQVSRTVAVRSAIPSGVMLIVATFVGLNAGTAKEAALTAAVMNGMGVLILLGSAGTWKLRLGKLACMIWANVLVLLLSAPFWMMLLDSIKRAHSAYNNIKVFQLQPALAIGMFDELFQRQIVAGEYLLSSSANFLILLGTLWAVAAFRKLRQSIVFLVCSACVLCCALVIFGGVPASVLAKIPVVQTIYHFDNTFSFIAYTPLVVISGFGLREMWFRAEQRDWWWGYLAVALLFGLMLGAFVGFSGASHRAGLSVHELGKSYDFSRYFIRYATVLSVALLAFPWLCRTIGKWTKWAPASAVLAAVAFFAMHFRMGAHVETSFDHYTYNPKERRDFREMRSPALEFVKAATTDEPARTYGLNETLVPGFSIIPGIETLCGAEPFESKFMVQTLEELKLERTWWLWRLEATSESYSRIQKELDFLNVRYLLTEKHQSQPAPGLLSVAHVSDMNVLESKTAWPRAFFTDSAHAISGTSGLSKLVREGDGKPFAAVDPAVIAAHPSLQKEAAGRVVARARNYKLTSNTTSFDIDAPSPGLAVLHETNVADDFVAKVDGRIAPCLAVNGAFRGVWLDSPGTHRVQFIYAPRAWSSALRVAGIGLFAVIATIGCIFAFRRRFPFDLNANARPAN